MAQIAYVDWDGLVYYDGKIKKYITDNLEPTLKDGGIKTFEDIIEPSYEHLNYIYTISNAFTTNEWFDAAGRYISAGTAIKVSEVSPSVYRYTIFNEFLSADNADEFNSINARLDTQEDALNNITDSITELDANIQTTYATKDEVNEAIANIEHPTVDLSNHVTKDELETSLNPINVSISYLNENVSNLNTSVAELTNNVNHVDEAIHELETDVLKADYASKEYVATEIARAKLEAADVDLSAYYTKTEVNEKLAPLATSAEVSAINTRVSDLATNVDALNDRALEHEQSITSLTSDVTDLKLNSATKEELEAVQNVAGQNSVKLFQIDSDLVDINAKLDTIPTKTSDLVNDSNFLTEHQDISNKADKATTLSGYGITDAYTRTQIDEKLSEISSGGNIDLEGFVSEDEWNTRIAEYAKKSDIPNTDNFLTQSDLTGYAKSSDIPDVSKFVTAEQIPSVEGLATKAELSVVESKIPTNYLTSIPEEYVTAEELAAEGFIKEHQDLSAYALKSEIPTDYIKEIPSEYITESELDNKGYLTQHQSLDGYAKEQWVVEQGYLTAVPEEYAKKSDIPDVSNLATKDELPKDYLVESDLAGYAKTSDIPDDYLTEADLQGYSKFSGSYNDLTDKPEIPSIDGLATEDFVTQSIANIKIPEIDTTSLATKEELATKANDVLFSERYVVQNAIGEFMIGDSVQNMAIKDILIKLLRLEVINKYSLKFYVDEELYEEKFFDEGERIIVPEVDPVKEGYNFEGWKIGDFWITSSTEMSNFDTEAHAVFTPKSEEPDVPQTTPDIIISNEYPMYQVNESGEVVEISYAYETMTEEQAAVAPTHDCFYQIKDNSGNVIESGYQHLSEENDSMYYLVLLPNELDFNTNVDIEYWDNGSKSWIPAVVTMTDDLTVIEEALAEADLEIPEYDASKYTLWIDASLDTCAGVDYRFIINE